ncbi:Uncharacterised protein [Escherichia coli]|nr:Uncharacterised protein [Escherichia coli]
MAVHAPVCSMEKLSTTVFGQLSRKFPFRLSRMVTLLTRLKPELCSTIQGGCPDDRPRSSGKTLDLSGNPALSGHWGVAAPRCLWQRLSACFARTFGNCMTFMVRQKGTELHVNTFPGISRNTLQMTSFGAHSTPLRMPANSWRRWRHTSKILRKQK